MEKRSLEKITPLWIKLLAHNYENPTIPFSKRKNILEIVVNEENMVFSNNEMNFDIEYTKIKGIVDLGFYSMQNLDLIENYNFISQHPHKEGDSIVHSFLLEFKDPIYNLEILLDEDIELFSNFSYLSSLSKDQIKDFFSKLILFNQIRKFIMSKV